MKKYYYTMDTSEKKSLKKVKSRSLQRNSKLMSAPNPSSDEQPDPALLERLGLLLGDHRVSKVKIQNHPHPVLSHNSNNNTTHFNSSERKHTNISHLTTSPASTLSDKGIGSSVGSFDSEFRNNSKTGSLDSRKDISPSHSRTDSGINNHVRSSSDIIGSSDISQPTLSEQLSGKLWTRDPRRGTSGEPNVHPLAVKSATIDLKPRRSSKRSLKSVSSDISSQGSDKGSKGDLTKLPPVCPTTRSSSSSSRDITPSASYTEVGRTNSMHSNEFNNENASLSNSDHSDELNNNVTNNNNTPSFKQQWMGGSSASSSEQTLLNEEFLKSYGANYTGRSIIESITGGRPSLLRSQSSENRLSPSIQINIQDAVANSFDDPSGSVFGSSYSNVDNATTPTNDIIDIDSANDAIIQRMRTNSESGRPHKKPLSVAPSLPYEHSRGRSPHRAWNKDARGPAIPNNNAVNGHLSSAMHSIRLDRSGSAGRLVDPPQPVIMHHATNSMMWDGGHRPHPLPQMVSHHPSPSLPVALPSHQSQSSFTRHSNNRSSTRSNPTDRSRKPPRVPSDMRLNHPHLTPQQRVPDVNIHPLSFELPHVVTTETKFVGRGWLFSEILNAFNTNNSKFNKGVLIYGSEGHGKTSILHHLASTNIVLNHKRQNSNASSNASTIRSRSDYGDAMQRFNNSSYSSRSGSPLSHSYYHQPQASMGSVNYSNASSRTASPAPNGGDSRGGSRAGSQTSIGIEDAFKRLSSQVVAAHFCSKQDNSTCFVPEFIHSVAAQLAQSPMLSAYKDLLLREPNLQSMLRIRYCIQDPVRSLKKAVIEPLVRLRQMHKIPKVNLLILIDALEEAEEHSPDYGLSIIKFLQQHLNTFPDFLKIVATCKTMQKDELSLNQLPMHMISLDEDTMDTQNDIKTYISHRISSAASLANLTLTGKPDPAQCQKLLTEHLVRLCQMNFLYLRLTLDLLEKRSLIPKSSGFKVIPINISEVFLLMCNLKFQTSSSFDRVRDILAVTLASLYPLKDEQIYRAITSGQLGQQLSWEDFRDLMETVSSFLVLRPDFRRSFIHPAFREWLAEGNPDECSSPISTSRKFLIDSRRGHALLATVLSRQPVQLTKHACIELAHHLLKARMFRGQSRATGVSSNDLHALWMSQCSAQLSESLTVIRNLFFPNIKVSKLLLRAGADPNIPSQVLCEAPAICVAAHTGCIEFIELLLNHGADINLPATNGMTAFAYAAAAGHLNVVQYLINQRARMDLVDRNGHSPLLHAISRDHTEVAKLILTCNLFISIDHRHFTAEQALVAAATIGNVELVEYLLNNPEPALRCSVDVLDSVRGETPLTAAASRGKQNMCEMLVNVYRASIEIPNKQGLTPLLCCVKHGEWGTTEYLLNSGAFIEALDPANRTPVIVAASSGHMQVLQLLLTKGAILEAVDKENLSALGWAALKGHYNCAAVLIERGINPSHKDISGRTALDLAALFGHVQVVDLLLSANVNPEEKDKSGLTALDRGISGENVEVVDKLLDYGVPITPASWAMASGKTNVTLSLLKKTVDDGNQLYKADKFDAASDLYTKALRHIGESVNPNQMQNEDPNNLPIPEFRDICSVLMLGLARCARKLKNLELAEYASSRALHLMPGWYEALYVRARVRRELSRLSAALKDVEEAQLNAPKHNSQEINRLIIRIKDEIKKNGNRNSFIESSDSPVPAIKARHNSHSGNTSSPTLAVPSNNSRSSSPAQHEQYQPRTQHDVVTHPARPTTLQSNGGVRQLPQLYAHETNGMASADSMPSLARHGHARLHQPSQYIPHSYSQSPSGLQPYRHVNHQRVQQDMPFDPNYRMYGNGHIPAQPYNPAYVSPANGHPGMYGRNVPFHNKAATPPLPPKSQPVQNDPRQQVYRSMSNLPHNEGMVYKKATKVTDL